MARGDFLLKAIATIGSGLALAFLLLKAESSYFGAAAFLVLLPLFFVKPHYYFVFFIIIRPIVDITLRGNLPGNKLSALVVIPLIMLCVKDMLLNKKIWLVIANRPVLKKINFIFIILFIMYLTSFVYTQDRMVSLMDLVRYISIVVAVNYGVIYYSESDSRKDELIKLVLISAIVPLLFGFKQLITHTGIQETGYNRIFGTFAHCNVYAQYLTMTIYLAFHIFSRAPKKSLLKRTTGTLILLGMVSFYFTYTRTLWIAFAVAALVYIFLKPGFGKKAVYLGFALILLGIFSSQIKERFSDSADKHAGRRSSWQWRLEVWGDAVQDLKRHPVLGNGLGMFEHQVGVMAHNDFIRMAYETGIPSALLFFIFFVYLFLKAVGASRKAPGLDQGYFGLAAALVTALFISCLAVNTLRSTVIIFYYFCIIIVLIQDTRPKTNENIISQ